MKTASRALGIAAGVIGLAGTYLVFLKISAISSIVSESDTDLMKESSIAIVIVMGVLCAVGSILGMIGGCIVKENAVSAGAMMAAGGMLNAFSVLNNVIVVLLLLGAIFAFIIGNCKDDAFRMSARVLGITGGVIVLLYAAQSYAVFMMQENFIGGAPSPYNGSLALLAAIGGMVAVAGGLLAKKRRTFSGCLMFIGGLAGWGVLNATFPLTLLLVGGVFAFISEKVPGTILASTANDPGEA